MIETAPYSWDHVEHLEVKTDSKLHYELLL